MVRASFALLFSFFAVACSAGSIESDPESLGEKKSEQAQAKTDDEPPCRLLEQRSCTLSGGGSGSQQCTAIVDGHGQWSTCTAEPQSTGSSTPLVLSFASDGEVSFDARANAKFDLAGIAASVPTHWPTPATPWLVRDLDGNGSIDDGTELFGSMTRLASGKRASNGFEALRELDTDGDGWITPADASWSTLMVWRDADGDRVSSPDELRPLEAYGVRGISLGFERRAVCDSLANCGIERATLRFERDGRSTLGQVVDVHLPSRVSPVSF